MKYTRRLSVCDTKGNPIDITVVYAGGIATLVTPAIPAAKKDRKKFKHTDKNGVIKIKVEQSAYGQTIEMLTKYFESLFLKELDNDSKNTGDGGKPNGAGNSGDDTPGEIESTEGKETDSLLDRT